MEMEAYTCRSREAAIDAALYLEEVHGVQNYTLDGTRLAVHTQAGVAGMLAFMDKYPGAAEVAQ